MNLFDTIGETYTDTRKADERIVTHLVEYLGLSRGVTIADIGAGTGNYSIALAEAGFRVLAIEPSSVMLHHSRSHPLIEWREGCAENVPLPDGSVEGVIANTFGVPFHERGESRGRDGAYYGHWARSHFHF